MRDTLLPVGAHAVGEDEIAAIASVLRSDSITTGPVARRFEEAFRAEIGAEAAVVMNSCTAALHTALLALGVGPGDEVITTVLTFPATVNVIVLTGARPVLVDVEADTLNIDLEGIRAAITPRTRAIMVMHYAGHPCDMDGIVGLARQHGIAVVEDAAHAVTASYRGRRIGTLSDLTAFSFYASKNLTTVEGGALTGRSELIDVARLIARHGMRATWDPAFPSQATDYAILRPGYKYNLTDAHAAIGLGQLEKLWQMQAVRDRITSRYTAAFAELAGVEMPTVRPDVRHGWYMYVLRLRLDQLAIDRDWLRAELRRRNIGTGVYYRPIHLEPFYRETYDIAPGAFPQAMAQYPRLVALPLSARMTDQDADDVIEAVQQSLTSAVEA